MAVLAQPRPPVHFLVVLLILLGGCATSERSGSGGGSSSVLSFEMIDEISGSYTNAYDVVTRLRPQWFSSRGTQSLQEGGPSMPLVYVDGIQYGQVQRLRDIDSNLLHEIRYLGASQATTRFGTGHFGGAILVETRRGG